MKIELNETKVRTIATSLRLAIHTGQVTHSKVLEALSASLGFRNWDTFCGMLKRESGSGIKLANPVSLFVEVFATGDGDGPAWAQVDIDQAFIDQLSSLQSLCEDRKLAHVATFEEPTRWQGDQLDEPLEDVLNFDSSQLYVDTKGWWFHAMPRHCSYVCETRVVQLDMLIAALTRKTSTPYLAWYPSKAAGEPDVLVASSIGATLAVLHELVEEKALSLSYLP